MAEFVDRRREALEVESIRKPLQAAPPAYYESTRREADPSFRSPRRKTD
jgi:hypothetical protein